MIGHKNKLRYLVSVLVFCLCQLALGQQQSDAGLWTTFSIEKQITKKFSFEINEELRLKNNLTQLNLLYTNLIANYKPFKGFKIAFGYRSIQKYTDYETFNFKHRLMLDLSYKFKLDNIILSYRSRLQSEVENFYSSRKGKIPEWFWRNKFDFKYDLNKYQPYIGTELRYQMKDPRNPEWNMGWHRIRTYVGIDYAINSNNSIGIYYLIQREFGISYPELMYIIGLQYALSL